jgi:hypothetical protein
MLVGHYRGRLPSPKTVADPGRFNFRSILVRLEFLDTFIRLEPQRI